MSVLCRPPFGNGILYLFAKSQIDIEAGAGTVARAALLRATQVEAFDTAAVVHNAVFINGHRHLFTKTLQGMQTQYKNTSSIEALAEPSSWCGCRSAGRIRGWNPCKS